MFAHPLMLAWSAAAAVPLLLRLLGRATERTVDFSAMLFLPGGAAAVTTDAGRVRDWALLLLRSAALGLLAVAVARPLLPAHWSGVPADGLVAADPATIALVINDAAGTGYAHDGPPRFDAVTRVGLDLLAALGRGDRATVVPDPPPVGWVDGRPSADLSAAATAVAGLSPTRRPADVADALDRAAGLLADAVGPREVVVVCDREAAAWRNVTDAFGRRWRERSPPRVIVAAVGGEESDNVAVTSVRAEGGPLVRDVVGTVRVTVHNWGPQPRANLPLSVWTGPRQLADTAVSLLPHGSATVDVPVRLLEDGDRLISAAVRSRELSFDDRRDGVVDVVPPARVLVVTDDAAAVGPLRAALEPHATAGRTGGDPAVITTLSAAAWAGVDRARYDVVALADVGEVTAERADELRRFVDGGGGLLIAPGRHVSAGDYDDDLGEDGVGLLPAELSEPRRSNRGGELRLTDVNHPLLAFAADRPELAASVHFDRSFGVVGRPDGRVVATIDGRPAAVAAELPGGGRVLLLTVPLDDTWGPLTRAELFVPLVQSAVRWLAGGGAVEHEVAVGRPIVLVVDGAVEDRSAWAQMQPAGPREPLRMTRQGTRTELRYDRTGAPGTYRLRYQVGGRERLAYFVVVAPPEASDLTPMSGDDWRAMARRVGFERVGPTSAAVRAAVSRGRGGPEGWAMGVGGVLLLLSAETLLGRRWSGAATAARRTAAAGL